MEWSGGLPKALPGGFITVECEPCYVEATGEKVIDRFGDDFFVLDPIMEQAVGRIGRGGQAENSGNNIGVHASKRYV